MGIIQNIKNSVRKAINKRMESYSEKNYLGSVNSISSLLKNDVVLDKGIFYELYRINGDVRQAVIKIANSVARNGLFLRDNNNQQIEDEALEDEIASLFEDKTFLQWKKSLFKNYLISGELYIIPSFNPYGEVVGFEILNSQFVEKILNNEGNIVGYKQTIKNGKVIYYKLEDLAYFKLEDSIEDKNNGMSLMRGIVYDTLCEREAERTNYYFYKNSAIPSAMLILNDGLSKEQIQVAQDQFQAQFKGTDNQHKTMVAGNLKDFKVLAMTNRDMEFISQRKLTTTKVGAIFGVPKFILGYTDDANYNNGREQRKEFLEGTIKPYENDFEHILNTLLFMFRPDIASKYYVKCDSEQLEETEELHNSQRQDVLSGILTPNEVRVDRGLEPMNDENADKLITTRNAVLLEDIGLDAVLPANEV